MRQTFSGLKGGGGATLPEPVAERAQMAHGTLSVECTATPDRTCEDAGLERHRDLKSFTSQEKRSQEKLNQLTLTADVLFLEL